MSYDPIRLAIADHIKQVKPSVLAEWNQTHFLTDAAKFLDKHFPIEGGWGSVSITVTPYMLRKYYPVEKRKT